MTTDLLTRSTTATHDALTARLETAIGRHPTMERPRDHYPATDTFLAATSRHLAAVNATLVPAVKRLPEGWHRAHEFSHQSRRLEAALAQVKAKLYGSVYAISRPWDEIWAEVRREFDATLDLERALVTTLASQDPEHCNELCDQLYVAEQKAPTRPHPYVPHLGVAGKVARMVTRQVDHFWDTTEGRMIPEPVHVHDRDHQGRFTQYFLADPHLERIEEEEEEEAGEPERS